VITGLLSAKFITVLLFWELLAPFTHKEGARARARRTEAEKLERSGPNGRHDRVTLQLVARDVLVETAGVTPYALGRFNFGAANSGEQAEALTEGNGVGRKLNALRHRQCSTMIEMEAEGNYSAKRTWTYVFLLRTAMTCEAN
jgi:hypothetical protein